MRNPQKNKQHKKPVNCGIKYRERQIAPGLNGLHAAREAEDDSCNPAAPAVRDYPALHAALQQSGAVKPQIQQKDNRSDDPAKRSEPVVFAAVSNLPAVSP